MNLFALTNFGTTLCPEALCPLAEPLPPNSASAEGAKSAGLTTEPTSSSKRQAVGSIVSPADLAPAALAESGGSGSAIGQSTSGQSVVPRFVIPKKFVLKHSSQ